MLRSDATVPMNMSISQVQMTFKLMTHPSSQDNLGALYKSVPLTADREAIRVLDVLPGSRIHSTIRTKLRVPTISTKTEYEALSYTWGQSLAARIIIVNDVYRFPVTDHLFNALRRLRSPYSVRTIWADAICINQWDDHDKGRQIALMGDIYADARCVNVWLGESGQASPVYLSHILHPSTWHWFKMKLGHCREEKDWSPLLSSLQNHAKKVDQAIRNIQPHWHDRAWIMQEFLLAKEVYLCFGRSRVRFGMHWLRFHVIGESSWPDTLPDFDNFFQKVNRFVQLRSSVAGFGKHITSRDKLYAQAATILTTRDEVGLYNLIGYLNDADATDPKDFVYSLLGMVNKGEAQIIASEIGASCAQVYAVATYASIQVHQRLDILDYVTGVRRSPDLPTWAVDFAMRYTLDSYYGDRHQNHQSDYCIFEKERRRSVSVLQLNRSSLRLKMSAGRMGSIVEIMPPVLGAGRDLHEVMAFFRRAWSRIPQNSSRAALQRICSGRPDAVTDQNAMQDGDATEYCSQVLKLLETKCFDKQTEDGLISVSDEFLEVSFHTWAMLTGFENFTSYKTWKDQRAEDENLFVSLAAASWKRHQMDHGGLSIILTSLGLVMFAPSRVTVDDQVVIVRSHEPLLALRRDRDTYTFEGQLKVFGIDGEELLKAWDQMGPEEHLFVLK